MTGVKQDELNRDGVGNLTSITTGALFGLRIKTHGGFRTWWRKLPCGASTGWTVAAGGVSVDPAAASVDQASVTWVDPASVPPVVHTPVGSHVPPGAGVAAVAAVTAPPSVGPMVEETPESVAAFATHTHRATSRERPQRFISSQGHGDHRGY